MNKILRGTKLVYEGFVYEDGVWKYNAASALAKYKPDGRVVQFLRDYIDFVMFSGVVSDVTKIWLESSESSPTAAVKLYNERKANKSEKIPMKKVNNHIYYDGKRLLECFVNDEMIVDLLLHNGKNIDIYEASLKNAVQRRSGKSLFSEYYSIQVPLGINKVKPDDVEVTKALLVLEPYAKVKVEEAERKLSGELAGVIGYVNYIYSKSNRTAEEEDLLDRFRRGIVFNFDFSDIE